LTSTATNVLFISVLVRFPTFLRHVKAEGADPVVVVRLATFYELNVGSFLLLIRRLFSSLVIDADVYDSLSGLCFDLLQQFHCSSSLQMVFAVHTQSTTACSHVH
jgi:hypothetical protein